MGGSTLDMTKGSPWKLITQFAVPVFLSQVFQQLYNTADALIVGRFLGDEALAAVSASGPLIFLLISFFTGLSMGAGVTISRYFGAGDYGHVSKAIHTDVMLGLLSGIVLTVVGVLLTPTFLRWMGTAPEVLPDAIAYFRYYFIGVLAVVMYNMCKSIMNALGDSKRPLYYLIISSLTNIVLDLLFIRTFGMGVRGAAIATVIAQGISVVLCLIYIVTKAKILLPEKRHFALDRGLYADLLAQGFSMGFMSSIIYVGSIVLQPGINSLGYETIAGHTAARKLFSFSMMPLSSMAQAVNTYVAQNRGADNWERVRKGIRYAYIFCFSVTACLIVIVTPLAPTMVHLISGSSDPTVLGNGARYLRVAIPFFFALGLVNCSRLALQALGEKILPLLSSFIELFGKIIFAMVFIPRYHYSAVIWCEPIIWCFMAAELVISLYRNPYMRKGKTGN